MNEEREDTGCLLIEKMVKIYTAEWETELTKQCISYPAVEKIHLRFEVINLNEASQHGVVFYSNIFSCYITDVEPALTLV